MFVMIFLSNIIRSKVNKTKTGKRGRPLNSSTPNESFLPTSVSISESQMKTLRLVCNLSGDTISGIVRKALDFYFDSKNKAKTFKIGSYIPKIDHKIMVPIDLYAKIRGVEEITIHRWAEQNKVEINKVQNGIGDYMNMVAIEINDPVAQKAKTEILEGMITTLFDSFKEAFVKEAEQDHKIKTLEEELKSLKKK